MTCVMMYNPRKVEMNAVILKLNGCVIKIIRFNTAFQAPEKNRIAGQNTIALKNRSHHQFIVILYSTRRRAFLTTVIEYDNDRA